jgi:tetratricopeptide (TPR) repeat protein
VPAPRRAKALIDVARAYLRLGDLTKGSDARVALYEKGRAAAQKASALSPKDADAVFWDTANFAMVADTRGVMNSLFAVPDIKKGFERALALDPNHAYARQTLAKVHHAIPGFVGGSDDHARAGLLEVLRRDPDFTPAMVALAVLCADRGEKDEARTWAKKALEAKRSTLPNDYKKFDVRDAKAVLARLEGK